MRLAVALGVLAACSFDHGIPVNAQDDAPVAMIDSKSIDASGSGSATPDARPDAAPDARACPSNFQPIANGPAGSVYRIHGYSQVNDQSLPFQTARTGCVNEGGYLAIPNDANEIMALLAATPRESMMPWMWVGITDQAQEGTWLTVLGTTPYLVWGAGEPDGGTANNCLLLAQTNQMYDSTCGSSWAYACECEQ
ncbi:MAG TPA: C-type lectin domain-containing protein [Kofleriaceae bacterium]|nr:C-type lectin domain-containing protein [Kofleriaceae bacterium]